MSLTYKSYNPDVLNCLANLSSDEVFTPPKVANDMLDMLPADLWSNPDVRFLDPVSKSGVFLREVTKRLLKGLEQKFPDLQERLNHILTKQVFGIAITELTSLMTRRTLYCSKHADGPYSICTAFEDKAGNIKYENEEHTWDKKGKCIYCGASAELYERGEDLEYHAYQFIHTEHPEEIYKNMKFDVIIGNPPYHISDGGDKKLKTRSRGSAVPLYPEFVEQAKKLRPRYLIMITPSRWFTSGRGLNIFRDKMLSDDRLRIIVDYPLSSECFPGVEIKGGVSYFLWARDSRGDCKVITRRNQKESCLERPLLEKGSDVFIRFNEAIPILRKVLSFNDDSFKSQVSSQKPFGLRTYITGLPNKFPDSVKIYTNKGFGYIHESDITSNREYINMHKVFISMAYGAGEDYPHQIINKPFYGEPFSCCTETYLIIGPYASKQESINVIRYIKTRFFRFLVLLKKPTQHAAQKVYEFVPMQDFSKSWTDKELYEKYDLTQEEIDFIESMVRPME